MTSQLEKCDSILIVGGSGYLGSRIIKWLTRKVKVPLSRIAVADMVSPSAERLEEWTGVSYHHVDIAIPQSVISVFKITKPSLVIHTASPRSFRNTFDVYMRVNVLGTQNVLDAAVAEPSVKAFILTSSSSVTHDYVHSRIDGDENDPLLFLPQQRQPYHHSKALGEKLVLEYNRKRADFVTAAIRPSAMFGPGEDLTVPSMLNRAQNGTLRFQIGDGTNLTDFTFVDNTVYAYILLAEHLLKAARGGNTSANQDSRVEGEAFIITNDEHSNFWDFARKLGAMAGFPTNNVVAIPRSVGMAIGLAIEWIYWIVSFGTKSPLVKAADLHYSTITRTFNIDKAKKRLGYRPIWTVEEGMRITVDAFVKSAKNE